MTDTVLRDVDDDLRLLLTAFADEDSPSHKQSMEFTARLLLVQAVRDVMAEIRNKT
jgi:hypothetical protein